jgi:hypothetical protein
MPVLHAAELAVWLRRWLGLPQAERIAQAAALVEYFLLNAARRLPCPWAEPNACAVYEQRFFGCRAYGLWSPSAYQARRQQALAAAEQVRAAWAGLGVELPREVLTPPPEYCRQVRVIQGPAPGDADLARWEEELARLGADLPPELQAAAGDPAHLMARLVLGPQECLRWKLEVTRLALAGREDEARRLVEQARRRAQAWAG